MPSNYSWIHACNGQKARPDLACHRLLSFSRKFVHASETSQILPLDLARMHEEILFGSSVYTPPFFFLLVAFILGYSYRLSMSKLFSMLLLPLTLVSIAVVLGKRDVG